MKADPRFEQPREDFRERAAKLVAEQPEGERAKTADLFAMMFDIEDSMESMSRDLRDCNVILARMGDGFIRQEARRQEWLDAR